MKERKEHRKKPGNLLAFPQRQKSWGSNQIWGWLLPWERKRVRARNSQLNVMEPNWRAPSDD